MYFNILLLLLHIPLIDASYSDGQLNECLAKCGIMFDPMPEAYGTERSMGSTITPEHYSPWTVLLLFGSTCSTGNVLLDRCTGFIVAPDLILTAAHCIFMNYTELAIRCKYSEKMQTEFDNTWLRHTTSQLSIYIGYSDLTTKANKNAKVLTGDDIQNIILPSEFNTDQLSAKKALKHDYAVIKLSNPLVFGEYLRPICLSSKPLDQNMRKIGQMAGWGQITNETGHHLLPNKPHLITIPIQDAEECGSRAALRSTGFDENSHLCAGLRSTGGLEGDSGSALVVDISGRAYAVGIFSMLTTDSHFRNVLPDIFVRTSKICDTLRVINNGMPICKPYFQEIEISCLAILRERRIKQADHACGDRENCQANGERGRNAKVNAKPITDVGKTNGSFSQLHHEENVSPRKSAAPKVDLDQAAEVIYKSISRGGHGGGLTKMFKKIAKSDTEKILVLLTASNFDMRRLIAQAYKNRYQEDLIEIIQNELPDDGAKELILALLYEMDVYDAISLHSSMKGLGTDEHVLTEILVTRSNDQIRATRKAYTKLYNTQLETDIGEDTSGTYKRLLSNLCAANRDESGTVKEDKAKQDAQTLFGSGEKRLGTNENAFLTLLTQNNQLQLNALFQEYERLTGRPMEKELASEFSGDILDALNAIVHHALNPARYFADRLNDSIKNQNERDLIRLVVTRAQSGDLPAIGEELKKIYGLSLKALIDSESKATTKQTLANLAKANGGGNAF